MGAFPDEPEHFYHWLQTQKYTYRPDDFVPRRIYGDYLEQILTQTEQESVARGHTIKRVSGSVTAAAWNARDAYFTLSVGEETIRASLLVLACGTQSAAEIGIQSWRWFSGGYGPETNYALLKQPEIHILGTGLTTVDACLTLSTLGYSGPIIAHSHHGWLPAAHAATESIPAPDWAQAPALHPRSAAALMLHIRRAAKNAPWRAVMDALRPHTTALWQSLPPKEQARVFAHVFAAWNIHRHRMAPQIAAKIQAMQNSGQLILRRGRIEREHVTPLMLDCTGPSYDITRSRQPLLMQLLAQDCIRPAKNGVGIATTSKLEAEGAAKGRIYALGALIVGDWFECTAVPSLREQAQRVAQALAAVHDGDIPATLAAK